MAFNSLLFHITDWYSLRCTLHGSLIIQGCVITHAHGVYAMLFSLGAYCIGDGERVRCILIHGSEFCSLRGKNTRRPRRTRVHAIRTCFGVVGRASTPYSICIWWSGAMHQPHSVVKFFARFVVVFMQNPVHLLGEVRFASRGHRTSCMSGCLPTR
jgi:hypothetical protein